MNVRDLFQRRHPMIGMVHLRPLPGSPCWDGDWDAVETQARRDAAILTEAGADGLMVENFGDTPFHSNAVAPVTIAAMTRLVLAVEEQTHGKTPIGVNVLRNDALAALSIAVVTGARFIRVNVHTGAMNTDQGMIQGDAANTLRERARLGSDVLIFADVWVKHATPIGANGSIEDAAEDTYHRGMADALIISGTGTGAATPMGDLQSVRSRLPDVPLFVGSGATPETLPSLMKFADGAIVGSALKRRGLPTNPVDEDRTHTFFKAAQTVE